jgi:predicted Co/Zn/Cd cation transporter (cation efflux family)
METELQNQIAEILGLVISSVQEVKDFSVSQLPDIAQQYITYGIWNGIFSVVFVGVISIVLAIIAYRSFKHAEYINKNVQYESGFGFMAITSLIAFIEFLLLQVLYAHISKLVFVFSAPKVWLLVELKNLMG